MKSANLFVLLSLVSFLSACGGGGGGSSPAAGASSARLIPSSIAQSSSLSTASVAPVSSLAASSSLGNSSSSPVSSLYPDYNTSPLAADATGMGSTAVQVASKIKLGFNFGNTLEAIGGETAWGNPLITEAQIQWVKEAGFDAIRLPVAWDQYANQQTAAISLEWLNRVKQVVGYAVDNNLYVIVNIHWDGGWLENNVTTDKQRANNAKQKAFWQQIATHLRDFDEHLIFASANEPNVDNAAQMAVLDSYHQTFVDAVRATGGKNANRVLVLQGPKTDIEETDRLWTGMPSDSATNKLMAEVHFYTPFNFTLMTKDESWGKQFYYWGQGFHSATDTERNASWGQEAWVDQMFDLMKTRFVDQGIPVILGEYSAMRRDNLTGEALELHLASRAYYFRYVTERANTKGLIPFVWDTGSLFSRNNLVVTDQRVLDALLQGAGKTSSAAASSASAMSPAANSR
ncbi:glycoside hydrolase family 5 protein [Cellvibrio fontiphilus]|uniref:Glycoside hydrolase family 5 protein n=1 Tax=Cellvibrio fontiphilus TaxID=1815559 RepID=A0ABV7F8R7_9GAMM